MSQTTFNSSAREPGVPRVATEHTAENLFHSSGASVLLTTTYQGSDILDVKEARQIVLLVDVEGQAADNQVSILLLGAVANDPPAANADEWFALPAYDGSVSAALPSSTKLSGADFTMTPEWGRFTVLPAEILIQPTDNDGDEVRLAVVLDVSWCSYFQVHAADEGGGGTLAKLLVTAARVS